MESPFEYQRNICKLTGLVRRINDLLITVTDVSHLAYRHKGYCYATTAVAV